MEFHNQVILLEILLFSYDCLFRIKSKHLALKKCFGSTEYSYKAIVVDNEKKILIRKSGFLKTLLIKQFRFNLETI